MWWQRLFVAGTVWSAATKLPCSIEQILCDLTCTEGWLKMDVGVRALVLVLLSVTASGHGPAQGQGGSYLRNQENVRNKE